MTAQDTIETVADILKVLDRRNIPPRRRRDLVSGVMRICTMIGSSPEGLRVDIPALRVRIAAIRPAAHGISQKTFANLRSLFLDALEETGVVERNPRGEASRNPAWAPLMAGIANDQRLSTGLAAFANWSSVNGTSPDAVDDNTLKRFLDWLENRTLHKRPRDLVRQIPTLWADAQTRILDWPAGKLTPISFRPVSPNLRWSEVPESLRLDAEAYLKSRAEPDPFDDDPATPTRPLSPTSIRWQQEIIRLAVSVLVLSGLPIETLRSLADIVSVDAVKTVLRHYHEKAKGRPSAFAGGIAGTLLQIARYHVRVPEGQLQQLRRIAGKLPAVALDLTLKNKTLLATLENEQVRGRLLRLPDLLRRDVEASLPSGFLLRSADAQVAVAVDILLLAPLRAQNLIGLNWGRNFREPQGSKGKLIVYIPKDATKTKRRDLSFEIPAELAGTIRWYRREILPRLGVDPNGDLFPTKTGGRKSQRTLSQQITETIESRVGIHMTPHQFRHLAAVLYLEAHPEDFQSVTDLLGHTFSKTTRVYAGTSSLRASRAYGRLVIEQRAAALLRDNRKRTRK